MTIQLHHGDCLEVMPSIPDGSVDLILADPPYGTTACKWDSVIPLEPMWAQLNRVIKPNGAVVMTACQPFTTSLIASNMKMFKYCWVWKKSRPTGQLNAKRMPLKDIEDIVVFYKKQPIYNPQGVKDCRVIEINTEGRKHRNCFGDTNQDSYIRTKTSYPRRVLEFNSVHNVGAHPTQKPVALMEYMIRTYTNEGETVLDFTMGSGTTGVACQNTGRNFIGIEKNEGYFKIGKERIAPTVEQLRLVT